MPLKSVEFTTSGTWTPPVGVTAAFVVMTASGGGANGGLDPSRSGIGEFGASSGESAHALMIPVSHSSPLTVTIGAGGAGTTGNPFATSWGNPGNPTSIGSWKVLGSIAQNSLQRSQAGGGPNGATGNLSGGALVPGAFGSIESATHFGGAGGGSWGGGKGAAQSDNAAGLGGTQVGSQLGGGGGGGNLWAAGGNGGNGQANGANATGYGGGGGGGGGGSPGDSTGGSGANGYVAVFYMAP